MYLLDLEQAIKLTYLKIGNNLITDITHVVASHTNLGYPQLFDDPKERNEIHLHKL